MTGNIVVDSEIILARSALRNFNFLTFNALTFFGFSFLVANISDTFPSRIAEA